MCVADLESRVEVVAALASHADGGAGAQGTVAVALQAQGIWVLLVIPIRADLRAGRGFRDKVVRRSTSFKFDYRQCEAQRNEMLMKVERRSNQDQR